MTSMSRERLDPRIYDSAADQGTFDRDLHHADRHAVYEALCALNRPAPRWPLLVWGALILGLMAYVTWPFWQQVVAWLSW